MSTATEPILRVEDLTTSFFLDPSEGGRLDAVSGLSFVLRPGETLGIVGESGCGKSVTSKSIMRLIPDPPGRITGGRILYRGEDLVTASRRRMQAIRGDRIAMIFQEPMTALDPVFTIGWQIEEVLSLHQRMSKGARRQRAIELLAKVGMPAPERRVDEYPHLLSGGMRQRAMIAMALACKPDILIADEPTTALDVTVQAQILRLLRELQRDMGTAIILITHDLAVVAEVCDRVVVMYAGRVAEEAAVEDLFYRPAHPYTRALLASLPGKGPKRPGARLAAIPGVVPDLRRLPAGCRFRSRCSHEQPRCAEAEPPLEPLPIAPAGNVPGEAVPGDAVRQRRVRCFYPLESMVPSATHEQE